MWIINILWNNQNWLGRTQTVLIAVLLIVAVYYRTTYGIYKHKFIAQIELEKKELTEKLNELELEQTANRNRIRNNTRSLRQAKTKIEQKRKQDEADINNSLVTDNELDEFLANYEKRANQTGK